MQRRRLEQQDAGNHPRAPVPAPTRAPNMTTLDDSSERRHRDRQFETAPGFVGLQLQNHQCGVHHQNNSSSTAAEAGSEDVACQDQDRDHREDQPDGDMRRAAHRMDSREHRLQAPVVRHAEEEKRRADVADEPCVGDRERSDGDEHPGREPKCRASDDFGQSPRRTTPSPPTCEKEEACAPRSIFLTPLADCVHDGVQVTTLPNAADLLRSRLGGIE